jgi:signal peptidase I
MRTRHTTKLVSSGLGLIVLACLWFCFAPVALGGHTSYVVTDGVSMEPRFHSGDLVLVRSQSSYRVGQIVAYRSNVFHTIVLHRIIARDGGRYVFKGDNNNFVDFEHPAQSQLIGALWIHLPGAGARLQSLRSPALVGILVAIGTLLFAGAAFTQSRRRRRRQRRASEGTGPVPKQMPQYTSAPVLGILGVGLLALLPFLALALLAFTRPTAALLPADIPYRQSGALSYSADATPGPAYPGNRAVTGDPLFTQVLSVVDLRFRYRFHTSAEHALAGSAALYATVSSTSGWQTTLPLGSATHFRGDGALVSARLDLASLLALMRRVEAMTSVGGSYTLTITPHVRTTGTIGGAALHTTFSPQVQFSINQREVQPIADASGSLAGGPLPGGKSTTSQFVQSTADSATGKVTQPLFLSFKLTRLSVATARWIALGGIALISGVLLLMLAFTRPRGRREEPAEIQARYGRMIVPVERVWQEPGVAVIDVADMDSLVQIAERYDRSILHEATDEGDAFWVTDESGQFRYAIGAPAYAMDAPAYKVDAPEYELDTAVHAAYTPATSVDVPADYTLDTPTFAVDTPDYTPATATYAVAAPTTSEAAAADGESVERAQLDPLAGEVYEDELALGGVISASQTRSPAEAPAHGQAATNGRPSEDEIDVSTRETNEWRAAWDSTDAGRARARGAFAGLEGS